jgi:DNA-binding CsgD family transcriptional regulator
VKCLRRGRYTRVLRGGGFFWNAESGPCVSVFTKSPVQIRHAAVDSPFSHADNRPLIFFSAPESTLSSLLNERSWAAIGSSLRCSRRELEILTSLIEDRLDTEDAIGRALGISPHTVHTHLERLYRKVGVGSRAHLIVRVFAEYVQLQDVRQ